MTEPILGAQLREYHDEDLDGMVSLWQSVHDAMTPPVYPLSDVIAACQSDHAVVAVRNGKVIGAAVARAAHGHASIIFLGVTRREGAADVRAKLLDSIERRLAPLQLAGLSMLTTTDDNVATLEGSGFRLEHRVRYLHRSTPRQHREIRVIHELGGRIMPGHLWDSVAGMRHEKALLEERLVTPLAHPELASRFGVTPPHAVMLFGPPGTGKTTFAKAVASRLAWPFVEVFPSRLGDSAKSMASALRETFDELATLDHAVVFIDEVEEIASRRRGDPPSPTQSVTNELLKVVADFRDQEGRLLICATNFVRALDDAFLRHGRFDYVIPIGLPDAEARSAIWARYIPPITVGQIDLPRLVEESDGLTPADIEYAARRASQHALRIALSEPGTPDDQTLDTDAYLHALAMTRATVSAEMRTDFLAEIESFARL